MHKSKLYRIFFTTFYLLLFAPFSFSLEPNDKNLNLTELLSKTNKKINELDNKIKNKETDQPSIANGPQHRTKQLILPKDKRQGSNSPSRSANLDYATDTMALKLAQEHNNGEITEPTPEDVEQFKKDIEDSSFSKVDYKTSDLAETNFNIVPRDLLSKNRLEKIKSRINILMLERKRGVIPATDNELIYTDNLFNTSNNRKQELINKSELSVLSFSNTQINRFFLDYSVDHYYYSYYPQFNRIENNVNVNASLFTNKKLKMNFFDGYKPIGSSEPGGTDQLAAISWYNNNRFRPSLSYEISPKTSFIFAYENYYNNFATNKIGRESSLLSHTYSPSIRYAHSLLTEFELFYTFKSANYYNQKDPNYYSNGVALSMLTKPRKNHFVGTSLGFTERSHFNDYKNFSGLEFNADYKLTPTKTTFYNISTSEGIVDSAPGIYSRYSSIATTLSQCLFSPDLQFTISGLYKRTTPSTNTSTSGLFKKQIDNYFLLGTLLEYRLLQNMFLNFKYSLSCRDSNLDSANIKENRFVLELKVDELFNLYQKT
ncbi:MAG: hypothetical protein HQL30_05465 [Candidatus Omnitrophica bacterium]|nr:hypothetical protein [Candidatus Omnitrophota bacterium]